MKAKLRLEREIKMTKEIHNRLHRLRFNSSSLETIFDTSQPLRHSSQKFISFSRKKRLRIAFRLVMASQLFPDPSIPRPTQAEKFNFTSKSHKLRGNKILSIFLGF
jgi:hypothetical protein